MGRHFGYSSSSNGLLGHKLPAPWPSSQVGQSQHWIELADISAALPPLSWSPWAILSTFHGCDYYIKDLFKF